MGLTALAGLALGAVCLMGGSGSSPAVESGAVVSTSAEGASPRIFVPAGADGSFTCEQIAEMTPEEVWRNLGPIAACFSPDNPPSEKIQGTVIAATQFAEGVIGERHNLSSRWSFASENTQDTITWSFVPDGLSISNGVGEGVAPSETFSRFNTLFSNNTALWIAQFENSFNRWGELMGVNYVRITVGGNNWDDGASWGSSGSANRGNVRIATKPIDGGGGILAYNFFPGNGTGGNMVLDRQENWGNSSGTFRFLRNVIMHEHGHGIGLAHLCPAVGQTLMEPFINTSFDGPQHDDIRGGHFGYGDVFEPSDSPAQAVNVGTLSSGVPVTIGTVPSPAVSFGSLVSLDRLVDQDWYRFSTQAASAVSVSLVPVGRVYQDGQQAGNGSCPSGPTIDSRQIQDLAFQIVDANGSTVLATVNAQSAGGTESISDVFVGGPGEFYVRVYSVGGTNNTQLYTLSVTASNAECGDDADCDDGDPCNGIEVCIDGICFQGTINDCNGNGIDDACDIASGFSQDCNGNGIPDECDIVGSPFAFVSGNLNELNTLNNPSVNVLGTPVADTDVTLTIESIGQFASPSNNVVVFVGGSPAGSVLVNASNCPATPDSEQLIVPAATWNAARNGSGDVNVQLLVLGASGFNCGVNGFSRLSVNYLGAAFSQDCNGNGIPDECDIASGFSQDCNGNGIPDECDIASGFSQDLNGNGIPDECEPPAQDCPFDVTGPSLDGVPDGQVNSFDLNYYVGLWLAGDAAADITGPSLDGVPDGQVNSFDLNYYITGWLDTQGDCP
jgi:hypothetical protein